MSSFYGTIEDVDRYLMPRIRNRVQTLARPYKNLERGVCQHCGKENGTLEAAHVHGRDRKTIVREVLEKYRSGNGYHIVDLDAFEDEIVAAHEPIGETFLFLCRDCHREYDSHQAPPSPHASAARNAAPTSPEPVREHVDAAKTSPAGRPLYHDGSTSFQRFIQKTLKEMYESGVLDDAEIENLMDEDYSRSTFALCYPMLIHEKDNVPISGQKRYWAKPLFRDLCCCSEWQKNRFHVHEPKFAAWICATEAACAKGEDA